LSEILDLTHQLSDVLKREAAVVHAMASLPQSERVEFWHEQFLPLERQEQDLRQRLLLVGKRMPVVSDEQ